MKILRSLALAALLSSAIQTHAQDTPVTPTDDAELATLHRQDQEERKELFRTDAAQREAAASALWARDAARVEQVRALLRDGRLRTAADHWRAAFILQHAEALDDVRLAFSLATIATALAPENTHYRWLTAASWDRILSMKGQPQWFGTQFVPDPVTGKQVQEPLAEGAVSDAERTRLGVPTLAESRAMLEQINANR